jgi:hypothetical protein
VPQAKWIHVQEVRTMTGAACRAAISTVLVLALAIGVAGAGVPDPCVHCTIPTYIDLGGCDASGQPDPAVSFSVTLRDIGNFPLANQLIACSFDSDVRIYSLTPWLVSCQCVEATTDFNGVATFHVPGAGRNANGGASFTGASAATFYAWNCGSTTVLATAHVTTYDENGGVSTLGVEITDLSAWTADFFKRMTPPVMRRSDFNHSGAVDIVDLSYWVRVFSAQQSKYPGGPLCP